MERELALELARVTEAAALTAARWMGRGNKEAADEAAVSAMRTMFDTVQMDGIVVIGEGEMDEAPMLYIGERLGMGVPPLVDIAVDPLEGTNIVAKGATGALAVLAVAPRGSLLHALLIKQYFALQDFLDHIPQVYYVKRLCDILFHPNFQGLLDNLHLPISGHHYDGYRLIILYNLL